MWSILIYLIFLFFFCVCCKIDKLARVSDCEDYWGSDWENALHNSTDAHCTEWWMIDFIRGFFAILLKMYVKYFMVECWTVSSSYVGSPHHTMWMSLWHFYQRSPWSPQHVHIVWAVWWRRPFQYQLPLNDGFVDQAHLWCWYLRLITMLENNMLHLDVCILKYLRKSKFF